MIEAKVIGIHDMREALKTLVPKLKVRALRNALAAGARLVQKTARAATPRISASSSMVIKGYRKPGTVRKAISVRTSKIARKAGNVGVFVNVRPLKRGLRSARNPNDPFYWRWLEFGARRSRKFEMLQKGSQQLGAAVGVIMPKLQQIIAKMNRPKAPAP